MANINIRIDDALKQQADAVLAELGMNMTTATTVFLKQLVRHNGIPFEIKADPFFSTENQKTLRRINQLIRDAERDPFRGLGKPEPLKENLQGWWSRRINETDRLVYRVRDGALEIIQCRTHYSGM